MFFGWSVVCHCLHNRNLSARIYLFVYVYTYLIQFGANRSSRKPPTHKCHLTQALDIAQAAKSRRPAIDNHWLPRKLSKSPLPHRTSDLAFHCQNILMSLDAAGRL